MPLETQCALYKHVSKQRYSLQVCLSLMYMRALKLTLLAQ